MTTIVPGTDYLPPAIEHRIATAAAVIDEHRRDQQ